MFKKIFIFFVVFILIVFAGLAFFIATFDADKYRPMILEQASKALKKPIQIDKIKLGWHGNVALDLKGVSLKTSEINPQDFVDVRSVSVVVDLLPLLNKKIEVRSIVIDEPVIKLVKNREGIAGLEPQASGEAVDGKDGVDLAGAESVEQAKIADGKAGETAAAMDFSVDKVEIKDGQVTYIDNSAATPMEVEVKKIDASVRDVSLTGPIDFDVEAAVLSQSQNLKVSGTYKTRNEKSWIENLEAALDLNKVSASEWNRMLASPQGALPLPGGVVKVEVTKLPLDMKTIQDLDGFVNYSDGKVTLPNLSSSIDHISLEAQLKEGRVEVEKLKANFAEGTIDATGALNLALPEPLVTLNADISQLNLAALIPAKTTSEPAAEGILSMNFKGTARGLEAPAIQRSLSGEGQLSLERGVIRNLNIVREIFSKFSMIPGLVKNLEEKLPPSYQEKLSARDTNLDPVRLPILIDQGVVTLPSILIATDAVEVSGKGTASLEGQVMLPLTVFIEPQLSDALIHSVNELQTISDQKGRLQIPVTVQGRAPNISAAPDLQYIGTKIALAKTQELVSGFLQKKDGQQAGSGGSGTAPTNLLGGLLGGQTGQTTSGASTSGGGILGSFPPQDGSGSVGTAPAKTKPPKFKDVLGGLLAESMAGNSQSGSSNTSGSADGYSNSDQNALNF